MESFEILKIAANALNGKKAKEINAVKVDELTVLCEYFLICTANSSTQLRALCDEVEDKLKEKGVMPHHIEGKATGWILLDYDTVIVHVFTHEAREFYSLDKQWQDGKIIDVTEFLDNQGE